MGCTHHLCKLCSCIMAVWDIYTFILDLDHVCWDCLHSFVDLDTAQFNLAVNQVNNGGNLKSSTKKGTAQQCALKM